MIIEKLELENFGPFRGLHAIDLAGVHALAVVGENGRGKSACLDAVGYALYGRTRSRSADAWRSDGAAEMRVALELSGGVRIERGVRRGRGGASKGWVRLSGWEGAQARHADREVERLVGLEWEDYLGTRCLAQGDLQRLGSASPGERRALVERWLARPVWARASNELRGRTQGARHALNVATAAGAAAETSKIRALAALERFSKRLPDEVVEAEAASAEACLAAVVAEKPIEPPEIDDLVGLVEVARRNHREAQANAGGKFDGRCPVTSSPCPVADQVRADTQATDRLLAEAAETFDDAEAAHSAARTRWEKERRDWQARASAAERAHREARERLLVHRAAAEAGEAAVQAAEEAARDLSHANGWERAFAHRGDVVAAAARAIDALAAAEVEESVDAAERGAGEVLRALGSPLGVRFSHARDLREWAPSCASCGMVGRPADGTCRGCGAPWPRARRPELDLVVETPAGDRPFECVGGGQRDVVSLALRLAFCTGVGSLGFVLADEVLRQLDRTNREAVAQLLLGGGARAAGIEQVLLVAHDPAAVAAAPRLLQVVADGDGSRLEWLR